MYYLFNFFKFKEAAAKFVEASLVFVRYIFPGLYTHTHIQREREREREINTHTHHTQSVLCADAHAEHMVECFFQAYAKNKFNENFEFYFFSVRFFLGGGGRCTCATITSKKALTLLSRLPSPRYEKKKKKKEKWAPMP
jgi:hypothetical protein